MPAYVVLLRAVNIGKRQVKMAALREWLGEAGTPTFKELSRLIR